MDLVLLRFPEPLVILVHYRALVTNLDSYWYFEGIGHAMLGTSSADLDS